MSTSAIVKTESVKIADLIPHPKNYRVHDGANMETIKDSLTTNGQYRTVVANLRNNYILAGHGTVQAAQEIGWTTVEVNWVNADEAGEEKILAVDNRSGELSYNDDQALASLLESMMLAGQLKGTGYNPDDVDDLLAKLDALPETTEQEVHAQHAESAEETAARYGVKGDGAVVPMRQFVLMYAEADAAEVEKFIKLLAIAWGVSGARDVVKEALARCFIAEPEPPRTGGKPLDSPVSS